MTTPIQPVLIIGGGFSGAMLAARLAEKGQASIVIEKSGRRGLGIAYSTSEDVHRLNVRTANMGALASRIDDFQKWLEVHHPDHADPEGFAPRRLYGTYVQSRLDEVDQSHSGLIRWVSNCATAIDGNTVTLADGTTLTGRATVLASGNPPPKTGRDNHSPRRIPDPWTKGALERIGKNDDVLVLGTGLTMVDVFLSLNAAGWQGRAVALSRRGLAPRAHVYGRHQAAVLPETALTGPLSKRLKAARAVATEGDWRDLMDGYRSHTAALWEAASDDERARFLRHLRPWWDVHRHRIAPYVAKVIDDLMDAGRLNLAAGRVADISDTADGLDVVWTPRGTRQNRTSSVQWMIDCTGPGHDPASDPLTAPLIAQGRLSIDPLGLGLQVAPSGQVIAANGFPDPSFFLLGPPARAAFWETIAVPDLRQRIEGLVQQLA